MWLSSRKDAIAANSRMCGYAVQSKSKGVSGVILFAAPSESAKPRVGSVPIARSASGVDGCYDSPSQPASSGSRESPSGQSYACLVTAGLATATAFGQFYGAPSNWPREDSRTLGRFSRRPTHTATLRRPYFWTASFIFQLSRRDVFSS